MKSYMSVDRKQIQKAFALAHRLACHEATPAKQRNEFRAIAHCIWKACGEPQAMPAELPNNFPGTKEVCHG